MSYLIEILYPGERRIGETRPRQRLPQVFNTVEEAETAGWIEANRLMTSGTNALYHIVENEPARSLIEHPFTDAYSGIT